MAKTSNNYAPIFFLFKRFNKRMKQQFFCLLLRKAIYFIIFSTKTVAENRFRCRNFFFWVLIYYHVERSDIRCWWSKLIRSFQSSNFQYAASKSALYIAIRFDRVAFFHVWCYITSQTKPYSSISKPVCTKWQTSLQLNLFNH